MAANTARGSQRRWLRGVGRLSIAIASVLVVGAAIAVFAAFNSRPPSPDPGNHLFQKMVADPLVTSLPPGARQKSVTRSAANYRQPSIGIGGGGGWDGPYVEVVFTTQEPASQVYGYYQQRAAQLGWTYSQPLNANGSSSGWDRKIAKHAHMSLEVYLTPRTASAPGESTFTVDAAVYTQAINPDGSVG